MTAGWSDTTPPTISSVSGVAGAAGSGVITGSVVASDSGSGLADTDTYSWYLSSSPTCPTNQVYTASTNTSNTFDVSASGTYYVCVKATDVAGNTSDPVASSAISYTHTMSCAAGTYLAANATSCTTCPANSYCTGYTGVPNSSAHGIAACTSLGSNYTRSSAGATSSSSCYIPASKLSGKYVASSGSNTLSTCTAGYRCPGTSNVYYGSTGGRIACVASSSSTAGTYQPNTGQTSCITATTGNYVSSSGATSQSTCSAGYYCISGKRTGCAAGTYNPNTGQSSSSACINCPAGSYTSTSGKSSCTSCVASSSTTAGTYQPDEGKTSCTIASAGYYVSSSGATSQSTCPAGSYCTGGKITACSAGRYNSNTGQSSSSACSSCALGSYSSSSGSSSCTACNSGKTTSSVGQTSCNATCSNATGVYAWATASWSGNTVSNLCKVSECQTGYQLSNNKCAKCSNNNGHVESYSSDCTISACQTGYQLSNNTCTICSNNGHVQSYSSGCTISACQNGYQISNNTCVAQTCTVYCTSASYCSTTRPSALYAVFTCTGGRTGSVQECWYGSYKCNGGHAGVSPLYYCTENINNARGSMGGGCYADVPAEIFNKPCYGLGLSSSGYSCSC